MLQTGRGKVSEEIIAAMICEKTGWTYDQYLDQPASFIELMKLKMRLDVEHQEQEVKKTSR